MPQQPKITGDSQIDSWSNEVTNNVNANDTSFRKLKKEISDLNPATATVTDLINILKDL